MTIKNIKYIATSALYRLGKNPVGRELTWMTQVAIDYLSEKSPLDGNVSLRTIYGKIDTGARVFTMPGDCMRISKVGLKSGRRIWTLTPDTSLTYPEEFFQCESDATDPVVVDGLFPYGYFGFFYNQTQYGLGGGRNQNYYRIDGNNIIFDHNIPDGQLVIEYFSNGSAVNENTLIDTAYAEPFRLYLMSEYCLHKGNGEDKAKYKELQIQYEAAQWSANLLVKAPRLSEMIDALAQSSEFNLG
jgi:hypothetical protein